MNNTTPKLLVFQVHRVAHPFNMDTDNNPFKTPFWEVNWNADNSQQLTVALNNQVKNNYMELNTITALCKEFNEGIYTVRTPEGTVNVYEYPLTADQQKEARLTLHDRLKDLLEVISRDQDALSFDDIDVTNYALVLLHNGVYQGHIYAWLSNKDPSYCFSMGIRNRVDSIFTRYFATPLPNVSRYLLEGVRRFALSKLVTNTIVIYPRPIMIKLLPTMNFTKTSVPRSLIGNSIAPPWSFGSCNNCYMLQDITQPITANEMHFSLLD